MAISVIATLVCLFVAFWWVVFVVEWNTIQFGRHIHIPRWGYFWMIWWTALGWAFLLYLIYLSWHAPTYPS